MFDGNTIFYLLLQNDDVYYTVSAKDYPIAVILNVGDWVTLEYAPAEDSPLAEVISLEIK